MGGALGVAPLVSVIIPVYNGEGYLAEALVSAVRQDYGPKEIIVVDDGSTDGSREVARSFGPCLNLASQENCGTGAARNRGVELAKGSLLTFLDQDDVWSEEKLSRQVEALVNDQEVQVVFSHVEQFCSPDMPSDFQNRLSFDSSPVPGFLPSSMMIRREAFERVGPFETEWQIGEWANWYGRYQQVGLKTRILPETLVRRRLHKGNKGIQLREFRSEYLEIVRAAVQRRKLTEIVKASANRVRRTKR